MPKKDIPAHITAIIPQTADSVEIQIAFDDGQALEYKPGQFIMMEVLEPTSDEHWSQVGPTHLWSFLNEHGTATLSECHSAFPMLDERTIFSFVKKLVQVDSALLEEERVTALGNTAPELPVPPLKRAYSLGSTPTRPGSINTMVKEMPGGYVSHYLVQRLKVGEKVAVSGPLGHFVLPEDEILGDVLLIGAGSGITPLVGMLRWAKDTASKRHFHLVYSNKTPEDIIYKEELDSLELSPNIDITHTVTRPESAKTPWEGRTGRVDKSLIEELVKEAPRRHIYICGSMPFARSMKELLIELGADPVNIKLEAYG